MACNVMTDLMPEHRRQLGFGVQVRQQAAMNVDVAPTDGEGVDRLVIEHEELEIPVRDRRVASHARADHLHVVLQGLVLVQAVESLDLLVDAPCPLLLALHRGEDDVVRAALGIGGAACGAERGGAGNDGGECAAHGRDSRSEEHTSELQSQSNLVCRLLLEKKKTINNTRYSVVYPLMICPAT